MKNMNVNPLAQYLSRMQPDPGVHEVGVPGLRLARIDDVSEGCQPVVYKPSLYVVAQGSKTAHLSDEYFVYDELNFLVLTVPLALQCQVTAASPDKPYLAMQIDFNLEQLNEILLEMGDSHGTDEKQGDRGIFVSNMSGDFLDCLLRILKSLDDPTRAKVVAPLAIKEALYHVLNSEQGASLRAFAYRDRHHFQIATVIRYISENFSESLDVSELAKIANMSSSSFHHYFKLITSDSPIQYIKTIRLHEARKKMLLNDLSASDASYQVGYASPSQFSREYKRLFGESPSKDIEQARLAQ